MTNIKSDLEQSLFIFYLTILVISIGIIIYVIYFPQPTKISCIVYKVSGHYCETCGITRDLESLFGVRKQKLINSHSCGVYLILIMNNILIPIIFFLNRNTGIKTKLLTFLFYIVIVLFILISP